MGAARRRVARLRVRATQFGDDAMETRASTREGARGARALAREEKLGTVRFRFSRTRDLQDRTEPGVSRVQTQRRARGERVADHFKSDFAREVASSARVVGRARAPSSARQIDLLRFLNDFFSRSSGSHQTFRCQQRFTERPLKTLAADGRSARYVVCGEMILQNRCPPF